MMLVGKIMLKLYEIDPQQFMLRNLLGSVVQYVRDDPSCPSLSYIALLCGYYSAAWYFCCLVLVSVILNCHEQCSDCCIIQRA